MGSLAQRTIPPKKYIPKSTCPSKEVNKRNFVGQVVRSQQILNHNFVATIEIRLK